MVKEAYRQQLLVQKSEQNDRVQEILLQQRLKDQVVSMIDIETYVLHQEVAYPEFGDYLSSFSFNRSQFGIQVLYLVHPSTDVSTRSDVERFLMRLPVDHLHRALAYARLVVVSASMISVDALVNCRLTA